MNAPLPVVNVLPITSRKSGRRIYPNEVFLPTGTASLIADSLVLCYQIRTLDKQRRSRQLGVLNDIALQDEVTEALCFQLDIQ
jgi:mRNA interferase MazF